MLKDQHSDASDQLKAFAKKARELGCDESEEAFDRALKKIVSAPAPMSVQKRKRKASKR